jgi:predicted restriction endonuclease
MYCSHKCYAIGRIGTTRPDEVKRKISIGKSGEKNQNFGKQLPFEHRKHMSESLKKIHPLTKPIFSDDGMRMESYRFWRENILRRDNYTCQSCGIKKGNGKRIEAHHIKPAIKCPELRFDINNGITLCVSCHKTHAVIKQYSYPLTPDKLLHTSPILPA